jgi:hypothetical protein
MRENMNKYFNQLDKRADSFAKTVAKEFENPKMTIAGIAGVKGTVGIKGTPGIQMYPENTDDNYCYGQTFMTNSKNVNVFTDESWSHPNWGTIAADDSLKKEVQELKDLFFRKVVVKCPACGQFGAALCECKYCGHPIDLGER